MNEGFGPENTPTDPLGSQVPTQDPTQQQPSYSSQQQQQQDYAPYGGQQQQQQQAASSGLAIAALVIGILAFLPAFIPVMNILAIPLIIAGVAFAIAGIVATGAGKKRGRGLAIAGLVLSILAAVVCVVMYVSMGMMGAAVNESTGTNTASEITHKSDDYTVQIMDCKTTKDHSGDPAVVVTYRWKNGSSSAKSFSSVMYPKVFQDDVQLDTTIASGVDVSGYLEKIKPGKSATLKLAYKLENKKDDVVVEVGPLVNVSNEFYAKKTFSV